MEAARTFETLVTFYQTSWHYNPEDSHLWTSYCLQVHVENVFVLGMNAAYILG
jgi:hypothetical protein